MELTKVNGSTFYIKGGTNTGVYIFKDNSALIIDPGLGGLRPKKIINILDSQNTNLRAIINTHEHNDHYASCNQFKSHYKALEIMSSEYAKAFIENQELFSSYILGGKNNLFMDSRLKRKGSSEKIEINKVVKEGILSINGVNFNIIDFSGHTPGCIGILTPDKVLFVGDLLIGSDMFSKFDFLFMSDTQAYLDSLNKLKYIEYDYLVLGHSKTVISKDNSEELINEHINAINKYINQIIEELKVPMGIDNLLKNIILKNDLKNNYKEYHFFRSSLISVISYLAELEKIDYTLDNGELYYYTKRK